MKVGTHYERPVLIKGHIMKTLRNNKEKTFKTLYVELIRLIGITNIGQRTIISNDKYNLFSL